MNGKEKRTKDELLRGGRLVRDGERIAGDIGGREGFLGRDGLVSSQGAVLVVLAGKTLGQATGRGVGPIGAEDAVVRTPEGLVGAGRAGRNDGAVDLNKEGTRRMGRWRTAARVGGKQRRK